MRRPGFINSYGAYDNFAGLRGPVPVDGWATDTGMSLWGHFKPMVPWFIVTNLVTAIVIWKIASLSCRGRMAWGSVKRGIGGAGRAAKSKIGLKY